MKCLSQACWIAMLVGGLVLESQAASESQRSADGGVQRIGFVLNRDLVLLMGQWSPRRGWQNVDAVRGFPEPQSVFTLYDTEGRKAIIHDAELQRASKRRSSWDFTARLSPWPSTQERYFAVVVEGDQSELPVKPVALGASEAQALTQKALRRCGLNVESPLVTFAQSVDVNNDGQPDALITAHSDRVALQDHRAENIYSLAFFADSQTGKIYLLSQSCGQKPAAQSLEEYWRHHGAFPFYRFAALTDIDGDKRLEMTVYGSAGGDTEADIYTLKGQKPIQTLHRWEGY